MSTWVKLGTASGSSLTFSSIPNTYTDLVLLASIRDLTSGGGTGQTLYMQFNSDSSTIYSGTWLEANSGSAVYSSRNSAQTGFRVAVVNSTASSAATFGNLMIYIPNYANTSYNKTFICDYITENNGSNTYMGIDTGVWRSNAAIHTVGIGTGFTLDSNSTATLYGVKNS